MPIFLSHGNVNKRLIDTKTQLHKQEWERQHPLSECLENTQQALGMWSRLYEPLAVQSMSRMRRVSLHAEQEVGVAFIIPFVTDQEGNVTKLGSGRVKIHT